MSIGDIRFTVLQTVNEVMRKIGLDPVSVLVQNKISKELVDHINDVVSDLSDFGNWMECMTTAMVTAQQSVRDYTINTSAVIKNIGDIYITSRSGPLRNVSVQDMRIMTRVTSRGVPAQYTIYGTDVNGNPIVRVRPIPDASQNGAMFSILYYTKPPVYTNADAAVVIPFPARVVILGALASYTLRQNSGAPNDMYSAFYQQYLNTRRESLNRFNSDTGWDVSYRPSYRGRR